MKKPLLTFFIIILFGCFGSIGSDIYTASVGNVIHTFHTSAELVKWSVSIYMLGMALLLLPYGILSEAFGRKKPLLAGIGVALVGTVICIFAPSIHWLLLGRFVQGVGAGACACMWRAVFRDCYRGDDLSKYGSYFAMVIVFIIPAAPLLGGYLQYFFSFRANFVFIALYALLMLFLIIVYLDETHLSMNRQSLKFTRIIHNIKKLVTTRAFIVNCLCVFITYGAFFAWFVAGPVLMIHHMHISPIHYGWINFIIGAIGIYSASQFNSSFVKKFGMKKILRLGWCLTMVSGVFMLLWYFAFGLNLTGLLIPLIFFYVGTSLVWPNTFALAFEPIGKIAGYAGAFYASLQLAGGGFFGAVMAHLPSDSPIYIGLLFIFAPVLAWIVFEKFS